jgi:predicted peptidase
MKALTLILLFFASLTTGFTGEVDGLKYKIFEPKAKYASYKLLVFLPGGRGDEGFTGWCQSIYRMAIPDDFIAVQMIAPEWNTPSAIWPTNYFPTPDMKKPIDELFTGMVKDLRKTHKITKNELYTLSWSSGGPAAYVIAATQPEVKGHFIAMSVFRENWLPKRLRSYKNQRFFLYHSPDDEVCKLDLARKAEERLKKEKAEVKFEEYPGGHGWTQGVGSFDTIKKAFEWLSR